VKQCIEDLQKLGMNGNEAKVYISLLRINPVTGYQLSKETGIRRSVIYDVLQRLIDLGAVYRIEKDPVKYVPVPYDKFLDTLKRDFDHSIDSVRTALDQASFSFTREYIYYIKGAHNVRSEIRLMIENAERELMLELWEDQTQEVRPLLRRAEKRGVKIFTTMFSEGPVDLPGHVYYHESMPLHVVENRLRGQHTIVVRDNQEVLIGKMLQDDNSWSVITRDPALCMVAREFIIHDITILLMTREFGHEKLMQVLMTNPDMHGIILDRFTGGIEQHFAAAARQAS